MNKGIRFLVLILVAVAMTIGCAGQLAVKQVMVDPMEVAAGNNTKISVVVTGSKNKVGKVIATVRENPDLFFTLNDSGQDGDEKAGDNIWTYVATVPYDAPAAKYHLDIRLSDKEGNEIIAEGLEQQTTGRSGTVEVIVK